MADRVAILSSEGGRRKRKALLSPAKSNTLQDASFTQQRHVEAKAASCVGKLQRTDTDTTDEQLTADNGTQDSVQTAYRLQQSCSVQQCQTSSVQHQHQQHPHPSQAHQAAHADGDGSSGSEAEGPINDDKYIKGTRLVIGGWFQACRCQSKYMAMVMGCYPPNSKVADASIEPLHFWLPRLLAPVARLTPDQRREFCDMLVLRQDDAWLQLINTS